MRQLIEQMLEAMEVWSDARLSAQGQKAITAARSWLAAPEQSPVVGTKTWFENGKLIVQDLTAADVYKEPEQSEPVAFRCNFDGYGWDYRDNGSGSNWKAFPYKDKEFLYTHPAPSLREPEQSEPVWKKPPEYVPPLVKWAQEQTAPPLRELSDGEIRDMLEAEFLGSDKKRDLQDDLRVARAVLKEAEARKAP